MFYGCTNLKEINLLSFDTSNIQDMSYMFYGCNNLTNLDLSSFNTKNVTDMSYMFYCYNNLSNLDLSSFTTKKVTNVEGMFYKCNELKDLNLSSFYIKNVDNSMDMFKLRLKNIIDSLLSKKKQELMLFLLSNIRNDENLLKIDIQKIPNNTSFFPFVSKYSDSDISSNFILISNDIILIPTKHIYKKEAIPNSLTFPQIDENILFSTNNLIVENNNYNCNYSVIKVLNKHFLFKNYLKIPNNSFDAIDIKNREKFFVNINNKEESLGINIPYNTIKNYHQDSPIYIKKLTNYI